MNESVDSQIVIGEVESFFHSERRGVGNGFLIEKNILRQLENKAQIIHVF